MGMSGIGVHEDCVSIYNFNKSRKVVRKIFNTYRIKVYRTYYGSN